MRPSWTICSSPRRRARSRIAREAGTGAASTNESRGERELIVHPDRQVEGPENLDKLVVDRALPPADRQPGDAVAGAVVSLSSSA